MWECGKYHPTFAPGNPPHHSAPKTRYSGFAPTLKGTPMDWLTIYAICAAGAITFAAFTY